MDIRKWIMPLVLAFAAGTASWNGAQAMEMTTGCETEGVLSSGVDLDSLRTAGPGADTLNILEAEPAQKSREEMFPGLSVPVTMPDRKVEGTLKYRRGMIYTSDNQPLAIEQAHLYFTPRQVEIYRRNMRTFESGRSVVGTGLGLGLLGGVGTVAEGSWEYGDEPGALVAAAVLVSVVIITPCSIVGCPMMIKGSARLKKLVRQYNESYLFAE